MRMRFYLIYILLFLLFSCSGGKKPAKERPLAKNGILDLSGWDFEKHGVVKLSGQWEFYWNRLLYPADFSAEPSPVPTGYFEVPKSWIYYNSEEGELPGKGFATYRLKLTGVEPVQVLELYTDTQGIVYSVWLNGKLISDNGKVGSDYREEQAVIEADSYSFANTEQEYEIIVQISNFQYNKGGFWRSFTLGDPEHMKMIFIKKVVKNMFVIGALLTMGIYYLALFLLRRKDYSALVFSIFCFMISIRTFSLEPLWYPLFNSTGIPLFRLRVEYISFFMGAPFYALYIYNLFKDEIKKGVVYVTIFFSVIVTCITLLTPLRVFDYCIIPFQLFILSLMIYFFIAIIFALKNKREGAAIFFVGFLLFTGGISWDLIISLFFPRLPYISSDTFFIFVLCQSFIISFRFSRAFDEVESLSKRLLTLDKLKDEFLANTSHELRTPLNGIMGISQSLLDGAGGALGDIVKNNISIITASAKRLSALVNDILDFAKLKNSDLQLKRKPLDIRVITNMVLRYLTPFTGNKDIVLNNHIDRDIELVYGDENRLQQILFNLLDNAIKFTDSGEVRVNAVEEGDFIRVTVDDTGIGIQPEKFSAIFEAFEQADGSISRTFGGTGLGLSITKRLVELQGGEIRVKSVPGRGSSFSFTIPSAQGISQVSPLIKNENEINARGKTSVSFNDQQVYDKKEGAVMVLVVDDDPVNIQVITNFLTLNGYGYRAVSNGFQALDVLSEEKVDAVLLDVMMPRLSGYETCKRIREELFFSELVLPVLYLTAKNLSDDLAGGLLSGANDFITKPINEKELVTRLEFHVRTTRAARELQGLKNNLEEEVIQRSNQLSVRNQEILESVRYARVIQRSILPLEEEMRERMEDLFIVWNPRSLVGGDFYWYKKVGTGDFLIGLIDCTGHGVPGAFMTMTAHSLLNRVVDDFHTVNPAGILGLLNYYFTLTMGQKVDGEDNSLSDNGLDISLCLVKKEEGQILFAGANQFLFYVRDNSVFEIRGDRQSIGSNGVDKKGEFKNHVISYSDRDLFFMTSDGVLDQIGGPDKIPLGRKRFKKYLLELSGMSMNRQKSLFKRKFAEYMGGTEQLDDIAVIGFKV